MAYVITDNANYTAIASQIRAKNGTNTTYRPDQMAAAIAALPDAADLDIKTITENGTYLASADSLDGYSSVSVAVPNSYAAADEGKVVSNGALVAQSSLSVTENGTYDTTTKNSVVVNVSGGAPSSNVIIDPSEYEAFVDLVSGNAASYSGIAYPCNMRVTSGSSLVPPLILREPNSGDSNICLYFGRSSGEQVAVLLRKIPASASRLYVRLYAKSSLSSSSAIVGFATEPDVSNWADPWSNISQARTRALVAVGPGSSSHVIGQEGVVISVTDEKTCPYQLVEVDMTGVSVDCYPTIYTAKSEIYVREMYYA